VSRSLAAALSSLAPGQEVSVQILVVTAVVAASSTVTASLSGNLDGDSAVTTGIRYMVHSYAPAVGDTWIVWRSAGRHMFPDRWAIGKLA
jgi:hypothetical protein